MCNLSLLKSINQLIIIFCLYKPKNLKLIDMIYRNYHIYILIILIYDLNYNNRLLIVIFSTISLEI